MMDLFVCWFLIRKIYLLLSEILSLLFCFSCPFFVDLYYFYISCQLLQEPVIAFIFKIVNSFSILIILSSLDSSRIFKRIILWYLIRWCSYEEINAKETSTIFCLMGFSKCDQYFFTLKGYRLISDLFLNYYLFELTIINFYFYFKFEFFFIFIFFFYSFLNY